MSMLPALHRAVKRVWRFSLAVIRAFVRDRVGLQSSSLTYVTLMSMVPVLALMFAVAKGLNAHEKLMAAVQDQVSGLPESVQEFVGRIFEYVDKTNFSTLGAIGLVLLFWTVISLMGQIETAFNSVWHISTPRTLVRRFQAYISTVIFVPIFLLAATSVNGMLSSSHVTNFLKSNLGGFYWLVESALGCAGLAVLVLAFTLLYLFMPNTRVRFSAALFGGVVGGIAWYATQFAYIRFGVGVAKYNAIYGTFAVIPIFLAWLYTSWLIVIVGAICGYLFQNRTSLADPAAGRSLSFQDRLLLALAVMQEVAGAAVRGQPPWQLQSFLERTRLPGAAVRDVVAVLIRRGLLAETVSPAGAYLAVRALNTFTPADVEEALRLDSPPEALAGNGAGETAALASFHPELLETPAAKHLTAEAAAYTTALRQHSYQDLTKP